MVAEQDADVRALGATGTLPFDLPREFLVGRGQGPERDRQEQGVPSRGASASVTRVPVAMRQTTTSTAPTMRGAPARAPPKRRRSAPTFRSVLAQA